MPVTPYAGVEVVEVWFVDDIADLDAPTAAELNAGQRLTDFVTDGPPSPAGSNFTDAGTLADGFQAQVATTYGGGSGTMTIIKKRDTATTDDTADLAYNAMPRGTVGYLVVAAYGISGASDTFASGDEVSIYPITVANRSDNLSRTDTSTASIDLSFTAVPHINVAVAA